MRSIGVVVGHRREVWCFAVLPATPSWLVSGVRDAIPQPGRQAGKGPPRRSTNAFQLNARRALRERKPWGHFHWLSMYRAALGDGLRPGRADDPGSALLVSIPVCRRTIRPECWSSAS
jgi:hypothetical protein